jgi:hypothetical protein
MVQADTKVVSEEDYATWLAPRDALAELDGMGSVWVAADTINKHLSRSLIKAAAKIVLQEHRGEKSRAHYPLIKPSLWEDAEPDADHPFWETARINIETRTYSGDIKTELFGVRFDPAGIDEIKHDAGLVRNPTRAPTVPLKLPQAPPEPPVSNPSNRGGRPRLDFWEDLLVELFDQLWHGKLTPKVQADIENAMQDWLSANGHDASERSIRQRAQKLWKVWIKEGNN